MQTEAVSGFDFPTILLLFTTMITLTRVRLISSGLAAIPLSLLLTNPAHALVSTFTLKNASPSNTPVSSYTETVNGIQLTVKNAVGTDIPTAGGISGNANGLCVWLQNSAGPSTPNQRCGYAISTVPGATVNSQLSSVQFEFDKPVYLKDFQLRFNDVVSTDLVFTGPNSFTFAGATAPVMPTLFSFPVNFTLAANTPITFSTSNLTLSGGFTSGALRMSDFSVEEVPAPLPVLGAVAAFGYSRRLRQRIKTVSNPVRTH